MKLRTHDLILTALFAALTAIGAFIKIPMLPVPMTLQLFFVLLAGLMLGSKLGLLSQLVYIGIGLFGLPIFTEGGGPGYIFHPTFGYLLGFCLVAYITGYLKEKTIKNKSSYIHLLLICFIGIIICYIIGVPYLYIILNYYAGTPKEFINILQFGLLVFLPGDIIKAFLAVLVSQRLKNIISK